MRIVIHPQHLISTTSFRLIPHWNQTSISGSPRIGNESSVQAHPALDNSDGGEGVGEVDTLNPKSETLI